MKSELNVKAILIGIATILGISSLMGLGMAVAALFSTHFVDSLLRGDNLKHFLFVGGMICRFSGGFVTGWIAKHDQVKNAFALAVLDLILVTTITPFSESDPVLSLLLGIMTGALATICGGYLAKLIFERMPSP